MGTNSRLGAYSNKYGKPFIVRANSRYRLFCLEHKQNSSCKSIQSCRQFPVDRLTRNWDREVKNHTLSDGTASQLFVTTNWIRLSRNKTYLVKCQPWKWQSLVFRNSCHQLTYKKQFIYHKKFLASTLNRFIKRITLKNLFQKPALVGAICKIISLRGQLRGSVVEKLKLWPRLFKRWIALSTG